MRALACLLCLFFFTSCSKTASRTEEKGSSSPAAESAKKKEAFLVVAQEQQASWVRNFNPLLPSGSVRWPTPAGIYEPLMIYNTVKAEYVPWLATAQVFSEDKLTLRITTRENVSWSDGKAYSARDVAFTFNLLKKFPALDQRGLWKYIKEVTSPSATEVTIKFSRVHVPGRFRILQQPIVPEHVWQGIANPVTFTNPNPVATGPFTEVRSFKNQVYELAKNPNYWQPGKPEIAGLRFPALAGNEQTNLSLMKGQIDWSGKFIPDIDRVYVKKDPEHHKYWFPNMGGVHSIYANLTRAPLGDVRVRKAISMAINRDKLTKVAVYGYTKPAGPEGLSQAYKKWKRPQPPESAVWVQFKPEKANALLDAAGLKRGADGMRTKPDGSPLQLQFNVVAGWSDWVTAVQLISADLKKVGLRVKMHTAAYSSWFDSLQRGDFDLSMGWAEEGPSPYMYYRFVMGGAAKKPIGELAASNWQRFQNDEVDAALSAFELTTDLQTQDELSEKLQGLYSQHAPLIPLYPSPSWGICNTSRFSGFPSADDPYARLSPFSPPEYLLVLLNLKPR